MEQFKIVDLKSGISKDNKPYFYAILYSNLGYLCNAYLTSEEDFNLLRSMSYFDFDLKDVLRKAYNKRTQKFSYYIEIN